MDALARSCLERLLASGEKLVAGRRSRAASLTKGDLDEYRRLTSLPRKESFESTVKAASAEGAVNFVWERGGSETGFIERINLADARRLGAFLGVTLTQDKVAEARERLAPISTHFPVVHDVIKRWSELRKTRGLGPDSVYDWLDAARTIEFCRSFTVDDPLSLPIREASARLFNDSKRIEKLTVPLDVLLANSIEGELRDGASVWQELGLFREEHPVLLAGNAIVEREGVIARLDTPYVGLPAATVKRLVSVPKMVLTIENLTTFHSEARRRSNEELLLLYTAGMPSPAWRAMYIRILASLPADTPVHHWGDIDEGGFRIAATLAGDARTVARTLLPWSMRPEDVPQDSRRKATPHTMDRIRHFANAAGWSDLGEAIAIAGFTVEQESITSHKNEEGG
jgi:hypothetical protein